MRAKILTLGLAVWFIVVFGTSALAIPQMQRVEWDDKGKASVYILSASYDEVWEKMLDILLFEKFKLKGAVESTHETITIEKNSGLIIVKGFIPGGAKYTLKVTVHQKDCNVFVQCGSDSIWRKRIIEKFFQYLKRKIK